MVLFLTGDDLSYGIHHILKNVHLVLKRDLIQKFHHDTGKIVGLGVEMENGPYQFEWHTTDIIKI